MQPTCTRPTSAPRSPPSPSPSCKAYAPKADEPEPDTIQADLGPDLRSALGVLRPLLSAATAEALEPLLRASRDRLTTRYSEAKWEVAFSASPVA